MCGIVGIAGKFMSNARVKAFSQMLFMDTLRGWDSTGVVAGHALSKQAKADEFRTCRFYKRALAGPDFLGTRVYQNMIKTPSDLAFLLGHNRAATVGKVVDDNAHPFIGNYIALVHNGSLDYHYNLCGGRGNQYSVDSEAIMHHLDDVDDADLPSAIEEITGAFSLVWYDKVEDALYFIRNEERPMYFAAIKGVGKDASQEGLLWASVPQFIDFVADKHNITLVDTPEATKVGTLYKFTADGSQLISEREVNVHVPKKWVFRGQSGGRHRGRTSHTSHGGQGKAVSSQQNALPNLSTSQQSTQTTEVSGTTSSQQMSGTHSNQSCQQGTHSQGNTERVAPGAPVAGQYIEFAVNSGSYVGQDSGQQSGWCKAANGLRYVVTITGVKADAKLHGIYRAKVTMRYSCKDLAAREGFSTDRLRVSASESIIKINGSFMAVYDSKHATQNYDMRRDHKAVMLNLESIFPKEEAALEKHSQLNEEPDAADVRRFYIGEDDVIVDAYRLETFLGAGCGCCGARISRDEVHAGAVEWWGFTPLHEQCVDFFLEGDTLLNELCIDDDIPF